MIRQKISKIIKEAIEALQKESKLPQFDMPEILVDIPKDAKYGDYSTNIALKLAKKIKQDPLVAAKLIANAVKADFLDKTEIMMPGFVNFFVSDRYLQAQVAGILKQKNKFGKIKQKKPQKINIEFISANPTGPLTLGNGRGGFCGDVLANVLESSGYKTTREYYSNDRGAQINKLGHSVIGDNEAVYRGQYIEEIKDKIRGNDADKAGEKAAKLILDKMIKRTAVKMGIKFDVWFSEKSLYSKKEIQKALYLLEKKALTYEKDGALWFNSTKFGDDKDRVLIKENGEETYILSDIAYLQNKFKRGFEKLIFFWGADHFGYIDRLKGAGEALGYRKENIHIIIMQMVRLFEGEKEVKMSKRAGAYITLDELIDEVGLDVARFFFLMRSPETHLNFDLNLAKEQSQKNPVYYIQYAHARICSILANSGQKPNIGKLELLKEPVELDLIKQLVRFPEVVADTAVDYGVSRIPQYAIELADVFHRFYEKCRVIGDDKDLTSARLALVYAAKIIIKNTLDLMGISAPEKM